MSLKTLQTHFINVAVVDFTIESEIDGGMTNTNSSILQTSEKWVYTYWHRSANYVGGCIHCTTYCSGKQVGF